MGDLLDAYNTKISEGKLKPDPAQAKIANRLDHLCAELRDYQPAANQTGWKSWLGLGSKEIPPKGIYIVGDVGRGKTMLMDLFFEIVSVRAKSRVHFHEFMQNVHARAHYWRKQNQDPIEPVANEIAAQSSLLCFDEFQVSDITDAMILGRLFSALFDRGVVVVATSNVEPEKLYEHGLNRGRFLRFIKLFLQFLEVVTLESPTDYRLERIMGRTVYYAPLGKKADAEVQDFWEDLTDCSKGTPMDLEVSGRILKVPQAFRDVARFSFSQLCEEPLGPGDYVKLAKTFRTVFIERVPKLNKSKRNEAKRFVTLIDALYDNGVRVVISAAVRPGSIYPEGDHAFEFGRTVSRLNEMQSEEYLEDLLDV